MTNRTKTGLEILQTAVIMGVLGNILLRQTPWGLNAFLFVALFVTALIMLTRKRRPELLTTNMLALLAAMVFFASMFLIRDSIQLRVFDTLAIIVIMGVLILSNVGINARIAGAAHYIFGVIWAGINSVLGPFLLIGMDVSWKEMPGGRIGHVAFSVLRGIAIALPLVLIFGALFMAADAAFENFANRIINFDLETIVSHVMITAVLAWLTAGYFRGSLVTPLWNTSPASKLSIIPDQPAAEAAKESSSSPVEKLRDEPGHDPSGLPGNATVVEHINRSDPPDVANGGPLKKRDWQNIDSASMPSVFTFGTVETVIIFGLLDLLFVSFVILQVPYLFGGMELVQNTPDFKLAEYARRGFGELVAVSALVLPLLLVSHWLIRKETGATEKIFRALAGIQIALLFVIMASAFQRLLLYSGELGYGMTTDRFYPMVFMIWLAVVFGWFAITVFTGRRRNFAWGALWSAIVLLAATNLMNPDGFIARTNVALMQQGREFDADYNVTELSDDAVPMVLEAMPLMSIENNCTAKLRLNNRLIESRNETDLRSWNLSRSNARSLLEQSEMVLLDHSGCPWQMSVTETPVP